MGASVSETMKLAADDVESLVLPECGHYPAEEAPKAMLSALTAFLAPVPGQADRSRHPHDTGHRSLAVVTDCDCGECRRRGSAFACVTVRPGPLLRRHAFA